NADARQRPLECRGCGGGYGSVSGSTRTAVVNFSGYLPRAWNFNSTKNAVQPFSGGVTRPIHVFGPDGVRTVGWYAGPITSSREFRAFGLTACHVVTSSGLSFAMTLIAPSCSNVHWISGRGVPLTIAA